ncbi:MAG: hypothetical protein Q8942_18410, partial [Bacillota bacterium]|nr:hypothetical protein [Bacillota bacterium]
LNNDTLAISLISDIKKVEEGVLKNEVETGQFKELRYVLWDELLVKALVCEDRNSGFGHLSVHSER